MEALYLDCGARRPQLKRNPLDSTPLSVFFLVYEAHPHPAHHAYGTIDGAFISLWVNESLEGPARAVATAFINEQGWDIAELTDCYSVSLETYPPGNSSREHLLQALQDDVVAIFHTWPIGAPEE